MAHYFALAFPAILATGSIAVADTLEFVTFADARPDGGIRTGADIEDGLDSPGDVFVFDQQLLDDDADTVIGRNAGYCIRTDPGAPDFSSTDHPDLPDDPTNNYGHCSWTLVFFGNSGYTGSLTVTGRESDQGTSLVPIVGGTGQFTGATGVLVTTPMPQSGCGLADCGILFKQELVVETRGNDDDDSSSDDDD